MSAVSTCYISVGCNQSPQCVDWGRNNLICYGSCRALTLCQPEDGKTPARILSTSVAHKDKVNCVRWIRTTHNSSEEEVISGSVDHSVIVWKKSENKLQPVQILKGHTAAVISVEALCIEDGQSRERTLIISTSVDSSVKIWSRGSSNGEFTLLQSISFGSGFCLDVSVTLIPNTNLPLLACGGDDQKIYLYVEQNSQFIKVLTLLGHEDWIRGLDFTINDSGDILLASCSQDYIIRIWRITSRPLDAVSRPSPIATLSKNEDIKVKENTFAVNAAGESKAFAVSIESVMCGHDNWIYSIRWQPPLPHEEGFSQPMCLLSTSMDKTMILWRPDPDTGVWIEQVRVGEVGGNTLGLYGGMFSHDGNSIIAHGYHGAFHQWTYSQEVDSWKPVVTCKGHFGSVQDLSWDIDTGQFLISVSLDQTSRLHAPWISSTRQVCWYEVARPQVHGYDLQCLTMINKYKMASGAEEKVIRVFDAPKKFLENLSRICDIDLDIELKKYKNSSSLPEGASVPALGLSNKAVFHGESEHSRSSASEVNAHPNEQYPEIYFSPVDIKEPPTEEHLLQNALWPETQKLYGHGYEIFTLASDPDGKILASSCKAAKAEHANIILWDTETWKQICSLEGASLTVTQLEFSHNGLYLLSVSRDRTWRVYKKRTDHNSSEGQLFSPLAGVDKKNSSHSRIIWSGTWSHDDQYFFTASRDKKVLPWRRPDTVEGGDMNTQLPCSVPLDLPDSATAVACAPVFVQDKYLLAIGLDNGTIGLYFWSPDKHKPWTQLVFLDQNQAHHLTVKRLKFRPCQGQAGVKGEEVKDQSWLQLASCGSDWAVKIYSIDLPKLRDLGT